MFGSQQGMPGLHKLTLDLAGRYDDYSVVGHTTVPDLGLNYEPFDDQLSFHASVGRSFGAPQLYQDFGPAVSGPIPPFNYQSYYGFTASAGRIQRIQRTQTQASSPSAPTPGPPASLSIRGARPGSTLTLDFFGATRRPEPSGT